MVASFSFFFIVEEEATIRQKNLISMSPRPLIKICISKQVGDTPLGCTCGWAKTGFGPEKYPSNTLWYIINNWQWQSIIFVFRRFHVQIPLRIRKSEWCVKGPLAQKASFAEGKGNQPYINHTPLWQKRKTIFLFLCSCFRTPCPSWAAARPSSSPSTFARTDSSQGCTGAQQTPTLAVPTQTPAQTPKPKPTTPPPPRCPHPANNSSNGTATISNSRHHFSGEQVIRGWEQSCKNYLWKFAIFSKVGRIRFFAHFPHPNLLEKSILGPYWWFGSISVQWCKILWKK